MCLRINHGANIGGSIRRVAYAKFGHGTGN
jgi:hypothetical protein